MRIQGPGQWHQWQYGNLKLPLVADDDPDAFKSISPLSVGRVAAQTVLHLEKKGEGQKFRDAMDELIQSPDLPDGRINEVRFGQCLQNLAVQVLEAEELAQLFPAASRSPQRNA
eukprot:gnl/MRDRNA2_/MRDRNA2_176495_c0_seq1.p1 gnl/MRDRNA2_/MRDRNA2_176495_c0~~gnl/MRDRNA2_/MRDRNA2_176495_c0_seq1.p1  ORF type:complete len:114 (-),score=22.35 gnl/MRDRNA2_/MRDRNA2_176495_c0_seq1:72-413(-)